MTLTRKKTAAVATMTGTKFPGNINYRIYSRRNIDDPETSMIIIIHASACQFRPGERRTARGVSSTRKLASISAEIVDRKDERRDASLIFRNSVDHNDGDGKKLYSGRCDHCQTQFLSGDRDLCVIFATGTIESDSDLRFSMFVSRTIQASLYHRRRARA